MAFDWDFEYPDATIYYQKIEDSKYGYSMEDRVRICNGKEVRNDNYYKENPF